MCENNIAVAELLKQGFSLIPRSEIPRWPQTSGRQWFVRNTTNTQNCIGLDYNIGGGLSVQLVHRKWIPDSHRFWDVAPSEFESTHRARLAEMLCFQDDDSQHIATEAFTDFATHLNGTITDWFDSPIAISAMEWRQIGIQAIPHDSSSLIANARKRWKRDPTSVSIQWQGYFAQLPTN